MFIIKSKETGLYYKNKDYHGCMRTKYGEGDSLWTDDPNECKPFRSVTGAKSSRVARKVRPVMVSKEEVDTEAVYRKHYSPSTVYGYGKVQGRSRTIYITEGGEFFYYEDVPFDEYLEVVPVGIAPI